MPGQTVQLVDLKTTKKLFPDYKSWDFQVLQDVVNPVATSLLNLNITHKNCNSRGNKFKSLAYHKSVTYPQINNLNIIKDEHS